MKRLLYKLVTAFFLVSVFMPAAASAVRIKDVSTIGGMRSNQLIGYGLIVGLENSGDRSFKSPFTVQTLISMLKRLGTTIDIRQLTGPNIGVSQTRNLRDVRVENIAAVMVVASLPPFARPGQRIDVIVSSLGDAKNISGGTLLMTPLKAANGEVYAVAQGILKKERSVKTAKGISRRLFTRGTIPNAAIVEKGINLNFAAKTTFQLLLNTPDFTTAKSMEEAVNAAFGKDTAKGLDAGTVELTLPANFEGGAFRFMSDVESIQVEKDTRAKVVLDERTGTVVIGENVEINSVAISFAEMTIRLGKRRFLMLPALSVKKERVNLLKKNSNINELVNALNALGVSPHDLVAIFRALRSSGALNAELEIM